jgi:hypothetical protein
MKGVFLVLELDLAQKLLKLSFSQTSTRLTPKLAYLDLRLVEGS